MKTKISTVVIGNLNATITSDVEAGEVLDSKIEIEAGVLCFVSGPDRTKVVMELNEVISKYRI